MVFHETVFDDSGARDVHADQQVRGRAAGGPSLPSYTGKFTTWRGFNQNTKTVDGTFTFIMHG